MFKQSHQHVQNKVMNEFKYDDLRCQGLTDYLIRLPCKGNTNNERLTKSATKEKRCFHSDDTTQQACVKQSNADRFTPFVVETENQPLADGIPIGWVTINSNFSSHLEILSINIQ